MVFLSANEKCRLLLITSGRFFHKYFIVNHSSRFRPLLEGVEYFECPVLGGFTEITKLITTRLIVAFINQTYFFIEILYKKTYIKIDKLEQLQEGKALVLGVLVVFSFKLKISSKHFF